MSASPSLTWCEHLLFGHGVAYPPPSETPARFALRMQAEHLDWSHVMRNGGLTALPYHVHGDLSMLLEHLETTGFQVRGASPGPFRTRIVARFWDQLQVVMASFRARRDDPPSPSLNDDALLKELLLGNDPPHATYESADFWGSLARRFLKVRRPLPQATVPLLTSIAVPERLALLYNVTCQARGDDPDPLAMALVPRSEYVNPLHWQSPSLLGAFLTNEPRHPFTQSVQTLLRQSIDDWMRGQMPPALQFLPLPSWRNFLHNVRAIHGQLPEVPQRDSPPLLVDVLQRLLAVCRRDDLWEKAVLQDDADPPPRPGMDAFWLTEGLQRAERENQLLWAHLREKFE